MNIINVAFAEDHAILSSGLYQILNTSKNIKLLFHADNGQNLINRIKISDVVPDVCLLDIRMPVMDGYDTAHFLKHNYPGTKTIALSNHGSEFNVIKMIKNGASGYLVKECSPDEIFNAIAAVYAGGKYISQEVAGTLTTNLHLSGKKSKYEFTDRELEFIKMCCSELSYKQIADKMKVTLRTVDGYREHVFEKLGTGCRTGIVLFAIKAGLVAVF